MFLGHNQICLQITKASKFKSFGQKLKPDPDFLSLILGLFILSLAICNLARLFSLFFWPSLVISHKAALTSNAQTFVNIYIYRLHTIGTSLCILHLAYGTLQQTNSNSVNVCYTVQGSTTFKHGSKRLQALLAHLLVKKTVAWRGTVTGLS